MAATRLLVTTFNLVNHNMKEAATAKREALASGLLTVDRTNELWESTPDGFHRTATLGGLDMADYGGSRLFGLLGLTRGQRPGWERLHRDFGKQFPEWLIKQFSEPVACWYLTGHHHLNRHYSAMSWGTPDASDSDRVYRPYAGVGIDNATQVLEFFGYRNGKDVAREVRLDGARASLKDLSLMIVGGCNGIPRKVGGGLIYTEMAQAWRNYLRRTDGSAPLILGWFNTHRMPRDQMGDSAAALFWPAMKQLASTHSTDLAGLCTTHTIKVIQAWGKACYTAFHKSRKKIDGKWVDQRHLWYFPLDNGDSKGAGAVAPNGDVYNGDPAYRGAAGTDPMLRVGSLP